MAALVLTIIAGLIALAGGFLALWLDTWRAWIVAFCAGALISAAMLLLLPDAIELVRSRSPESAGRAAFLAAAGGFFAFFLLENLEPGVSDPVSHHAHAHSTGVWGAAGIALHGFVDGAAIGQAFHVGEVIGWGIALAILTHKFADGVSVAGIMRGTQQGLAIARLMIVLTAVAPLAGLAVQQFIVLPPWWLGMALAWFAGVFLYLGTTSLLPAAYAATDARTLPLAAVIGVVFVTGASLIMH